VNIFKSLEYISRILNVVEFYFKITGFLIKISRGQKSTIVSSSKQYT